MLPIHYYPQKRDQDMAKRQYENFSGSSDAPRGDDRRQSGNGRAFHIAPANETKPEAKPEPPKAEAKPEAKPEEKPEKKERKPGNRRQAEPDA